MTVSLEEMKTYLRVDYSDDDDLISSLITTAEELVADVARVPVEALSPVTEGNTRVAILYTVAYLYEHREEADHHHLALTLRSLLFGIREPAF